MWREDEPVFENTSTDRDFIPDDAEDEDELMNTGDTEETNFSIQEENDKTDSVDKVMENIEVELRSRSLPMRNAKATAMDGIKACAFMAKERKEEEEKRAEQDFE
jgi:hypothetical protein